ncbi:MAG: hypothetical protein LBS85_08400 [Clostridiales Family XIII bacterium]|jgi:hypothetical protein|nr:hypothetical protein [Clostridiales Family XIII bacterium]
MNYDDLLELLELETPSELVYFEQYAELAECGEDISVEALSALAAGIEADILTELTEGYFEDMLKFVPDDEVDLYTLLSAISATLSTLAQNEDEESARLYADELFKFRAWYLFDGRVRCTDISEGTESEMTVMEALTNYRLQNFIEDDYHYDFSDALDYPLDEYIVSLSSIIEDDYGDGDTYGEDEDYRDPGGSEE